MRTSTAVGLTTIAVVGVGLHLLNTYSSEVLEILRGPKESSATQQAAASATPAASPGATIAAPEPPATVSVAAPVIEPLWPGSIIDQLAVGSRRYSDLTVVSVTSTTVTFRGGREIVSVPTSSLPGELKEMALAYLSESSRSIPTRTGSPAFPAHQRSIAANPVPQPRPAVGRPKDAIYLPEYAPLIAKRSAAERAEKWFRSERPRDPMDILPLNVTIELEDPILISESDGYWRVRGQGHVETRQPGGGGSIRKTQKFEVAVVVDAQGNVPISEITLF